MAAININEMAPTSGRQVGEANNLINTADLLNQIAEGGGSIQGVIEAIQNAVAAVDEGAASGGSTTTLVDATKAWQVNMWQGSVAFIMHAGQEYACKVASNSATTLNFTALAVSIIAGDTYEIKLPVTAVTVNNTSASPVVTSLAGSTTLLQNNLTLTGASQQLPNTPCRSITTQAEPTNGGMVYIGNSNTVSSTNHMYTLSPGSSVTIAASNFDQVYVIGTAGGAICVGGEQ
jgi:hypothetical protein